jgi:transposase-like protein
MDQWVKRTQRDYTLAFKLAVVDQVERGELTYAQAQERYGIQGASTVLVWLRKHGRQDWKTASSAAEGPQSMSEPPKPLTPEQRIKELEVQLKEAQEKAQFFEAVVDVLKRDYGVKVAKKPAGKSSRKSSSKG